MMLADRALGTSTSISHEILTNVGDSTGQGRLFSGSGFDLCKYSCDLETQPGTIFDGQRIMVPSYNRTTICSPESHSSQTLIRLYVIYLLISVARNFRVGRDQILQLVDTNCSVRDQFRMNSSLVRNNNQIEKWIVLVLSEYM